jgi:hypothetical protein
LISAASSGAGRPLSAASAASLGIADILNARRPSLAADRKKPVR